MELETLQTYLSDNNIEELILEMTEALLKDKPQQPRKYLLGRLEEEIGDGINRNAGMQGMMEIPGENLVKLFESTRSIT